MPSKRQPETIAPVVRKKKGMARLFRSKSEYQGIISEERAVGEDYDPEPWPDDAKLDVVGTSLPRIDGEERTTGGARYTFDIVLPGMLYARVIRSPYPHARVRSLDLTRVQEYPGVRAVITRYSIPADMKWSGEPVFGEVMRFAGDELAALAADDEYIAGDASGLVDVDYEPLPFVIDAEAALQPGAPKILPEGNLAVKPRVYQRGSIDHGFAAADVVVEQTFRTQSALHNCMETHGSVASWNGDELTVWESTQSIYHVKEELAAAFSLPLNKIRVICEYMGGGFGSKQYSGKWTIIAVLLARSAGRPVRLMMDRHEENLATGNRAPTLQRLRVGALNDGTLTAVDLMATVNVGAYRSHARAIENPAQTMYACPNVRTEVRSVVTNTGPQRSFRGPGSVEGAFPLESLMDELAGILGMDPLEIRKKNNAATEPLTGQAYSAKNLDSCYEIGAGMIGWKGREKWRPSGEDHVVRGMGMACQVWGGGGGPPAYAWVRLNPDATAEVIVGSQDVGTGTRTVHAQIAAEELGIDPARVVVRIGDTALGPYDPVSWGSKTVSSVGPAVRQAAIDARNQLYQVVADYINEAADRVRVEKGKVHVSGEAQPRITLKEILDDIGEFTILGKGARGPNTSGLAVRTFGAQFAEVEVDKLTGEVRVLHLVTAHDFGRVINPLGSASQAQGAVIQGIGYALTEDRVIDAGSGQVLNADLEGYQVPTALDFGIVGYGFVGKQDPVANIIGVKGLGEPSLIPTAPAIANAIKDATGIRLLSLPMTRQKILEALRLAESEMK
jgi:CO/xanthine dehydrogenase Mo-binding subunit